MRYSGDMMSGLIDDQFRKIIPSRLIFITILCGMSEYIDSID
jgi:hypothetical protein